MILCIIANIEAYVSVYFDFWGEFYKEEKKELREKKENLRKRRRTVTGKGEREEKGNNKKRVKWSKGSKVKRLVFKLSSEYFPIVLYVKYILMFIDFEMWVLTINMWKRGWPCVSTIMCEFAYWLIFSVILACIVCMLENEI